MRRFRRRMVALHDLLLRGEYIKRSHSRTGCRTTANREENWCWASAALLRFPVESQANQQPGRIVELR
jgi:hypothetical protein